MAYTPSAVEVPVTWTSSQHSEGWGKGHMPHTEGVGVGKGILKAMCRGGHHATSWDEGGGDSVSVEESGDKGVGGGSGKRGPGLSVLVWSTAQGLEEFHRARRAGKGLENRGGLHFKRISCDQRIWGSTGVPQRGN